METNFQHDGNVRHLQASEVAGFVRDELFADSRSRPTVVVTTDQHRGCSFVDVDRIGMELRLTADVVQLETGDATWALSDAMPPRLDVYGGAARIYWPGLTPQSEPYDHRLYFVYSDADARRVEEQIISAVRMDAEGGSDSPECVGPSNEHGSGVAVTATVTAIGNGRIEVAGGGCTGVVVEADLPMDIIANCLNVGSKLDVRLLRRLPDGTTSFSLRGMLPNTWEILGAEVRVGEVLKGRVQNIARDKGRVFVDVLPGVVGICHIRELHFEYVKDIGDYVEVGEILPFEILSIDPNGMNLELSRKRAFGCPPRPSPSLVPSSAGGRPFEWTSDMPRFDNLRRRVQRGEEDGPRVHNLRERARVGRATSPDVGDQVRSLTGELEAALAQRTTLVNEIRALRQQVTQMKKDLRSAADRYDGLARKTVGEVEPLSSERAFLLAIRLCHARMFEENDRLEHPLRRMRIGPDFLRTVRDLNGVSVEKIVERCTQVVCGIATAIPACEVHQLRDGFGGAGTRKRKADNAKAWRCSLQDNTASARRLHWWSVPGEDGGVIELASVGLHDAYGIPG